MDIFSRFYWVFLVIGGLVGLCVVGLIGLAAYWLINDLIDKYQQSQRRPMATSMSAQALREKRQSDAAARRLQIRVIDGWARK